MLAGLHTRSEETPMATPRLTKSLTALVLGLSLLASCAEDGPVVNIAFSWPGGEAPELEGHDYQVWFQLALGDGTRRDPLPIELTQLDEFEFPSVPIGSEIQLTALVRDGSDETLPVRSVRSDRE